MKKEVKENNKEIKNKPKKMTSNEKAAIKISVISLVGNAILSLFKLIAGIAGASYAMLADSIHSLSDVITTIIVICGVKISSKAADKEHPYGHERFECVAALILSFMLFTVGISIGYSAVSRLIDGSYKTASVPGTIALVAAIVSILEQMIMFIATTIVAKRIRSGALKADAWHHLSDSLSSIGSFIGILGAMCGILVLDIVAGFVICLLIVKVAIDVFVDAVKKMTDHSASPEVEEEIKAIAYSVDGVINIDRLRTRQFGNMVYVDLELACNGELKLIEAHEIAQSVHDKMETEMKEVKHCLIHINPYDEERDKKFKKQNEAK